MATHMNARTLLVATRNMNKVREIAAVMEGLGIELRSLRDFPEVPDVAEDGSTFAENAVLKARAAARATGLPALADDSGLEVDALGGEPGVRSARYAGAGHDDAANNRKLLLALQGVPPERRTARFRCAMAFVVPLRDGERVEVREGSCEGRILEEAKGTSGFGYDPLFFYPPLGQTFAELGIAEKNRFSHRAKALEAIRPVLVDYFTPAPRP